METPEKEEWILVEAFMNNSLQTGGEGDESRLAALVERYRQGRLRPSELGPRDAAELMSLVPTLERMESASRRIPVPEDLSAAVERYYRAEKSARDRRKESDSIVLRIREGLELISATLAGIQPVLVPASVTRRSATAQKINMREEAIAGGMIEYDILKSSDRTAMVSVLFRDLNGPLTVCLTENGRPVSSQTIRERSGRIHFDGLSPGEYRLDLTGSCERSFTLQLLAAGDGQK